MCIATKDAGFDSPYFSYLQIKNKKAFPNFDSSWDFKSGIICIDLLTRLLRLTNLHTNDESFGFVE
jgi:hypothetical protein